MAKEPETENNLQLLKNAIRQKQPARLYFFHGQEVFLRNHYLNQLKKLLIDDLTESFNYHKLSKETFSVGDLSDILQYPPMMAERTLTVVDEVDIFGLPEEDRKALIRLFADIPEYCTVVFTYETTPWSPDKKPKLLESVNKYGIVVEFARQSTRDLIVWVSRHFMAEKKQIAPDLCEYLVNITGGDMTILTGEIRKICAYSGAERICKSDIDAVTEPILDVVVFDMTDALGEGAYGRALHSLRRVLQRMQLEEKDAGKRSLSILRTISWYFRMVGAARILLDNGKSTQDLMRLCHASKYPAGKAMASAKRFPREYCAKAMELILETDYKLKTSNGDPEQLLELLLLQLAQEARHG